MIKKDKQIEKGSSMKQTNYIVLGAGAAGLTFANKLLEKGESSFVVLEKEQEAGGLCRSIDIEGTALDIGGGHFLDVRLPEVNQFLFKFMPENEWNLFTRDSKIKINQDLINHPIEANIWQMSVENQIEYLKSIAVAGCNIGEEIPKEFVKWIYWKLGEKIANEYMIPYNIKMFGKELDQLGTYWLEKLPNVSLEDTLRSCLNKKAYGTQPGHAQFYYPKKHGYGELWKRMAKRIENQIIYNSTVSEINFEKRSITTKNGDIYVADNIITTIPWLEFDNIIGMPEKYLQNIRLLKHSSIQIDYFDNNLDTTSHWIYYPDKALTYHRILVRHNFCTNSKGYWTETNEDRATEKNTSERYSYLNKYAYPLNTINKKEIMEEVLTWSEAQNVFGLGRWGEHEHYNSDVTVKKAIDLCEKLSRGSIDVL